MVKERIEDYLLTIYRYQMVHGYARTSQIARELGVRDATVTKVLKKLESKGLVNVNHYHGVVLTSEGMNIASKILRKHRIIELFLNRILGFNPFKSHELAHYMEHLPDEIIDSIYKLLGDPDTCIAGKDTNALTLDEANEGKCYQITCLVTEFREVINKLKEVGCWACCKIKVVSKGKSGLMFQTEKGRKVILTLDESKSIAVKEVNCSGFGNSVISSIARKESTNNKD